MDKSTNLVDKFATSPGASRSPSPELHRVAQIVDSTRGGTLGDRRPSRPSRAVEEGRIVSYRTDHSLTERELLRGYGLDPDDLELALIEGGQWRRIRS